MIKKLAFCIMGAISVIIIITLLFTLCASMFHQHEYAETVIVPTCTERGYTKHYCFCGANYTDSYVSTIGHKYTDVVTPPTCTKSGYTTYVCDCGDSYTGEYVPALGHSLVIDSAQEANCEKTGLTAGSHCSTCGEIVEKQHVIEKEAHQDENHDGYCDDCSTHFENIINITNADELKSISNDLSGAYRLTADISLNEIDWISLGSASEPFTGKLYGMGHCISGLSLDNRTEGGLFAYNAGIIEGVTLEGLSLSLNNISGTIGGLAAYNSGTIKNCKIAGDAFIVHIINHSENDGEGILNKVVIPYSGEIGLLVAKNSGVIIDCEITGNITLCSMVYFDQATQYPKYDGKKVSVVGTYGEICAMNVGEITNCKIDATATCQFINKIKYTLQPTFPYLSAGHDAESNVSIYFGGIAGKNSGVVKGSTVTGVINNNMSVLAELKKYGFASAKSYAYIGALVGENDKTINDCRAQKATFVSNVGKSSIDNSGNNGYKCVLEICEDPDYNGIIGNNRGEVSNTLYYN